MKMISIVTSSMGLLSIRSYGRTNQNSSHIKAIASYFIEQINPDNLPNMKGGIMKGGIMKGGGNINGGGIPNPGI